MLNIWSILGVPGTDAIRGISEKTFPLIKFAQMRSMLAIMTLRRLKSDFPDLQLATPMYEMHEFDLNDAERMQYHTIAVKLADADPLAALNWQSFYPNAPKYVMDRLSAKAGPTSNVLVQLHDDDQLREEEDDEQAARPQVQPGLSVAAIEPLPTKIAEIVEQLLRVLQNPDNNVVIFTRWVTWIENLTDAMIDNGVLREAIAIYHGKLGTKSRRHVLAELDEKRVLVITYGAGGVGLNLQMFNVVFLADSHWNPMIELQAQNRVHRIGQTKQVTVHSFSCIDGLDSRIQEVRDAKTKLGQLMWVSERVEADAEQVLGRSSIGF